MKKAFNDLCCLDSVDVVKELQYVFPELFVILVYVMLGKDHLSADKLCSITPCIAMIYSLDLDSRFTRIASILLLFGNCYDIKTFNFWGS